MINEIQVERCNLYTLRAQEKSKLKSAEVLKYERYRSFKLLKYKIVLS